MNEQWKPALNDDVMFVDVAGRAHRTRLTSAPRMVGQHWMVELAFGRGLFLLDALRVCTPAELQLPLQRSTTVPVGMRTYAGIGSRRAPDQILDRVSTIAHALSLEGYRVRSRGAVGCDTAFRQGAQRAGGATEVWIPWRGYNGISGGIGVRVASRSMMEQEAQEIAQACHPKWHTLDRTARQLMVSYVFIILGENLQDPVHFVVAWTPRFDLIDGRVVDAAGGTGMGVRLAASREIPVFHLGNRAHQDRLGRMCRKHALTAGPTRTEVEMQDAAAR